MDLSNLAEPFSASDIEWRVQQAGGFDKKPWALVLAYVTNRAIQQRLDDVCGLTNWRNEYSKAPDDGVLCGISIKTTTEWVTKYDGAENTHVEAVKGGLSGAMKRAAVQWGIGRYLYRLEATFVTLSSVKPEDMTGWQHHYDKNTNKRWYWRVPILPDWALPGGESRDKSKVLPKQLKQIADILTAAGVEKGKQKSALTNLTGQPELDLRSISYLEAEKIIKDLLNADNDTIVSLSDGVPF